MTLLALEFSATRRSVAVLQAPAQDPPALRAAGSDEGARSIGPLHLVNAVLTQARLTVDTVDTIAVGLGPGSYTGIRSAIALAQGWQLSRPVRIVGISSVECLAFQAQNEGWFGRVHVAIDAQRGEFYLADYEITSEKREPIIPLRLVTRQTLCLLADQPETLLVGPDLTRCSIRGRVLFPQAEALARLALRLSQTGGADENLEPIYLRQTTFVKAPPSRLTFD